MRNQYMAKVLVHNKVVTEAQVKAHWGEITDKKDIGQVLVDAGILPPPMYIKVLAFVKNLEAKAAAEGGTAPANTSGATATSAPAANAAAATPKPSAARFEAPPASSPSVAPAAPQPAQSEGLQIEGNSSLYGEVSTSNVEVEAVAGLESTSISTVQVQAEAEEETSGEDSEKLPSRFAILTGEGAPVEAPEKIRPMTNLSQIIAFARKFGATDIYLYADRPVVMRQSGTLFVASDEALDLSRINERLDEASKGFSDGYKIVVGKNFSKTIGLAGVGRARMTVTWNGTNPSVSIRVIPQESTTLENLYLPTFCNQFVELNSGLVLVAGPAASGRSTTISTFAETIAANRDVYIQTIEKPIERVLQNPRGAIAQREVGLHVRSGIEGVEFAMQSGADVILFDYLENMEELSMLLRASNAGALVFAVTTGNNIHALLSRLLSSVPAGDRTAFANSLAEQLKGIIVQHLIPIVQNQGQVLAVEAAKMNSTMANMLRRGEISQLSASISSQKDQGISLDDSLQKCVESGYIEGTEAWKRACDSRRFAAYRVQN
ncbi:Tfp pilus assembly protein PilT, pilus retraction ATPase [Fibrobacter sp. UWB15]|uniref:type IV pilus twitching motility protein PilT n=1 Tax=unclassified Fibrobacter TaxID=2634177 RepID=UPI000917988C|nr:MULTISPECIES: ATPase, T2SS/T4P/T4SS family [unclassified Fibrobacter]PWJ63821.1 Tfp pilus assembly pilus retraction ATPase PilT [Fibrobacter sp. UWB6]SHG26601.1 Tfp pilus assembly protein PilT, pilus retraction ATPase [Fibrobacter sp. UWB8]SMG34446.1 Tfp pilus assembly protein PilT, pilus retraction ATPase [Fibrobacter sp. UWB15]